MINKENTQRINIQNPLIKGTDLESNLKKSVSIKKLNNETFEESWDRIQNMRNSDSDRSKLYEVRVKMEEGVISRDVSNINKKFSKSEALGLWRIVEKGRTDEVMQHMVDNIPSNYKLITNKEELSRFIDVVNEEEEIVFDVETTGVDVWSDYIVGHVISAIKADIHAYIPTKHKDKMVQLDNDYVNSVLKPIYENKDIGKIAHNAKFDIHMLDREGIVLEGLIWDTQEAMKLLDENEMSFALKPLVSKYLREASLTYSDLFGNVGFDTVSLDKALAYAAKDGDVTLKLRDFQKHHMSKMPELLKYFEDVEVPLISVVVKMEKEGYDIDLDFAKEYGEELRYKTGKLGKIVQEELVEALNNKRRLDHNPNIMQIGDKVIYNHNSEEFIESEIVDYADGQGIVIKSIDKKYGQFPVDQGVIIIREFGNLTMKDKKELTLVDEININSHQQLKEAIEAHIGKPIDNTNAQQTLKPLAKKHDIINTLLEYRELTKILTTYVDALPELIDKNTGKLHSNFNQNGAKTGRFSSSNPNLQNQPSEARQLFVAPKGYYIVSADFSAQEVRIIASKSKEKVLLDAFDKGIDAYASLASEFFNKPYEECYKNPDGSDTEERKRMKVVLLMSMYGASKYGLANSLEISVEEADQFLKDFFNKYSKIDEFIKKTHNYANKNGFVWIGDKQRKRRLPDARGNTKYYDAGRNRAMRQGPNAVIQGEAAIQTKQTMIELSKESENRSWLPFAVIHDEVVILMPETSNKEDFEKLDEIMTQTYLLDGVLNSTDIEVQKRWGNSISVDDFLSGVEVPENEI